MMMLPHHCRFLGWACGRVARRLDAIEQGRMRATPDMWEGEWARYFRLTRRYSDAVRIARERYVDAHACMISAAVNRELSDLMGSKTMVVEFTFDPRGT